MDTTRETHFHMDGGLELHTYDARTNLEGTSVQGDTAFFLEMAGRCTGPVLELGCGTGRVTWPLAQAGHEVWALDLSPRMLELARAKAASHPADVGARVHWVQADMADFALQPRFGFIFVPFRAFQALLTPDAQRACLVLIRDHLSPGGRAVLDLFDPRLEYLVPDAGPVCSVLPACVHPETGREVQIAVVSRQTDPATQTFVERWQFTEVDERGQTLRQEHSDLRLRWSFRQELAHLIELCGLRVEALYGDFLGGPPAYGREQVWVLTR